MKEKIAKWAMIFYLAFAYIDVVIIAVAKIGGYSVLLNVALTYMLVSSVVGLCVPLFMMIRWLKDNL